MMAKTKIFCICVIALTAAACGERQDSTVDTTIDDISGSEQEPGVWGDTVNGAKCRVLNAYIEERGEIAKIHIHMELMNLIDSKRLYPILPPKDMNGVPSVDAKLVIDGQPLSVGILYPEHLPETLEIEAGGTNVLHFAIGVSSSSLPNTPEIIAQLFCRGKPGKELWAGEISSGPYIIDTGK